MYVHELLEKAKHGAILTHPCFGTVFLRGQTLYDTKHPYYPLTACENLLDDRWSIEILDPVAAAPILMAALRLLIERCEHRITKEAYQAVGKEDMWACMTQEAREAIDKA